MQYQPPRGHSMSQDFLDSEILADFFIEAKEHLETIEPNLLELEKSPENLGLLRSEERRVGKECRL